MSWKCPECENIRVFTAPNVNSCFESIAWIMKDEKPNLEAEVKALDDINVVHKKSTTMEKMMNWIEFTVKCFKMKTIQLRFGDSLYVIDEES